MSTRMSDTKALTGRLKPAELCTAGELPKFAEGSADLAMQRPQQEDYDRAYGWPSYPDEAQAKPRPAPGVGSESLSAAKAALK